MLTYSPIDSPAPGEWVDLLNHPAVRRHLMGHPVFTEASAAAWARAKAAESARPGCKLCAIRRGQMLAGWGGIQQDDTGYELALVLSPDGWGHGAEVMQEILSWAREFGHDHLRIHFPASRPQQKAMARLLGNPVSQTEIEGQVFNTYSLEV